MMVPSFLMLLHKLAGLQAFSVEAFRHVSAADTLQAAMSNTAFLAS